MPKKGWKAPEPRSFFVRIYCTKAELDRIDQQANRAGVVRAVFVREIALGTLVPERGRTTTISAIRFARILGSLNTLGAALIRLVDLLKDDEDPRYEHWAEVESRVSATLNALMKVLEDR